MKRKAKYIIGIDAGGTKTQTILTDLQKDVFICGYGNRPANPTRIPLKKASATLAEATAEVIRDGGFTPSDIAAVCLGVAGGGKKEHQATIAAAVAKLGITGPILVVSDVVAAFWGAIPDGHGVIAISGTGSSAYGADKQGNTVTAGGWGYLVGDEGSAFDIGRSGINAALKAYEGRGPATLLQQKLLPYFQLNTLNEIRYAIYDPADINRKLVISQFAPLVTQTAAAGDPIAQDILRRAGNEIGLSIVSVAQRLGLCEQAFPVGLIGGVFKAGDLVVDPLRNTVLQSAPQANVFITKNSPALGAVRLAIQATKRNDAA